MDNFKCTGIICVDELPDGSVQLNKDVLSDDPKDTIILSKEKYEILKRLQPNTLWVETIKPKEDESETTIPAK